MQAQYVLCLRVLFEVTGGVLAPPCARKQKTRLSADKPPLWSSILQSRQPIQEMDDVERLMPFGAKMPAHEPWDPWASLTLQALRVVMHL